MNMAILILKEIFHWQFFYDQQWCIAESSLVIDVRPGTVMKIDALQWSPSTGSHFSTTSTPNYFLEFNKKKIQ